MFAGSIPNLRTSASAVETATKCLVTARSSPSARTHQRRAVCAFVSVSSVVNVFEATTKSVSAGSRSRVDSTKSAPSTLDTKRSVSRRSAYQRSASVAMAGPRSEPPIPRLTTLRMARPVKPVHAPLRTRPAKSAIRSSTAWTRGTTSSPSTTMRAPRGARSAMCRTARPSVTLSFSPANIASMRARRPEARARSSNSPSVSSVTRCLE